MYIYVLKLKISSEIPVQTVFIEALLYLAAQFVPIMESMSSESYGMNLFPNINDTIIMTT